MVTPLSSAKRKYALDSIPAAYQDIAAWPAFDDSTISDKTTKARYNALVKATTLLLSNQPMADVMKESPVCKRQLFALIHSAMQPKPGGRVWGLEAFVRNRAGAPRARRKKFTPAPTKTGGYTGVFKALLTAYPSIEEGLTTFLNERHRPNKTTRHILHVQFMALVEAAEIPDGEYPRNTQSQARYPLHQWFLHVYLPRYGFKYTRREHGESAATALGYSEGDGQAALPSAGPYDAWVFDEVTVDLNARYELPSGLGDWEQFDLRRFSVIRLRSVSHGINLAWRLVLTPQVSAEDILMMLFEALSGPPKARAIVPDLDYLPGAGFPANLFETLRWAVPTMILLDNALSHLADQVQNLIAGLFAAEVKPGTAKTPKERAEVESTMKKQAMRILHQLPSTTGSGPGDPVRKAAAVPLEGRIEVEALTHVLDCYIANENVLPSAAANHLPAFERLQRLLSRDLLQPVCLPSHFRKAHYFSKKDRVPVKVDLRKGRKPHVNFLYARYSSDQLKRRPGMKDRFIWVRPDYRNLQWVMAFEEDGSELEPLRAEGHWGKVPNDLRIRKIYGQHKNAGALGPRADDQPLQSLYAYLRSGAPTNQTLALQLAYVVQYLSQHLDLVQLQEMEISAADAATRVSVAANDEGDVDARETQPSAALVGSDPPPAATAVPLASPATAANAALPAVPPVARFVVPRLRRV